MPYFTYPDLRAVMSRGNATNYALIFDNGVGTPTQSYMDKDSISLNSLLADAAYSEFFGGQNSTLSALNSGKLIYNSTVQRFQVSQNGGPFVNLGVGGLAGTGVAGQVTFWTDPITISGDNDFYWDNALKFLGLGTTTPSYLLDVFGNIRTTTEILFGTTDLFSLSQQVFAGSTIGVLTVSTDNVLTVCREADKTFDFLNTGTLPPSPVVALRSENAVRNEYKFEGLNLISPRTYLFGVANGDNLDGVQTDLTGTDMFFLSGSGGTLTTGNRGGFINLRTGSAGGTGNNNGGDIIFSLGTATGTGRQGVLTTDTGNINWQLFPGGTFNITDPTGTTTLTIDVSIGTTTYSTTSSGFHEFKQDVTIDGNLTLDGTMQSVDIVSGNAYIFGTMQSVDIVLDSGAANNCFIEFDGGENAAVSPANKGRLRYDTITQKMQLSENTSPYMDILTAGGVSILGRRATAVDTAIVSTDYLIAVTSTAAPRTITLPDATTLPVAQSFCIVDESGGAATNNITIATVGGQTINGATSFIMDNDYGSVELYTSGTNWFIK